MATRGWQDVTQADITRRMLKQQPKPSKYRNVRYETQGEKFDSKHESEIWLGLKAREAAKEIEGLQRQMRFSLYCPDLTPPDCAPSNTQVAEYVADFTFRTRDPQTGLLTVLHVLDAKSKATRTAVYKLKKKWLELQDGIIIEEV